MQLTPRNPTVETLTPPNRSEDYIIEIKMLRVNTESVDTEAPFGIPFQVPVFYGISLIVLLFTLTDPHFHLNPAVDQIEFKRNKGKTFFSHFPFQFLYLLFVGQEFPDPGGIMVVDIPEIVRGHMEVPDKKFMIPYLNKRVGKRDF